MPKCRMQDEKIAGNFELTTLLTVDPFQKGASILFAIF